MKKKVGRKELIDEVCGIASLPEGKRTSGFFTRHQLVELVTFIRGLLKKIHDLTHQEAKRDEEKKAG